MGSMRKRIKAGPCIATIFENDRIIDNEKVTLPTIALQRVYKAKDGEFKYSNVFRPRDIPKLMLVLWKAYSELTLENTRKQE